MPTVENIDNEISSDTSEHRAILEEEPTLMDRLSPRVVVEYVVSIILLLALLPITLAFMALVKLTSRGPALYRQRRLGLNGRPFMILKIRTMVVDCERTTGAKWATKNDPRITRLGRFLRLTHIDEFPQLINVLRGEMRLVGPRPERPEFVTQLEKALPHYRSRMLVHPGITGLAQVQLPPDTDLASVRRKLAHDLYYVRRRSFWLDCRIIICTLTGAIRIPYEIPRVLFGMPKDEQVENSYRTLLETSRAQGITSDAGSVMQPA